MAERPSEEPKAPDGEAERRPEQALTALLAEVRGLEQEGRAEAAEAALRQAPEELRRLGGYHYAAGALAFRRGALDEAIADFEAAVARDPEMAEYGANLGAALIERYRRGKAAADLQRAVSVLERAAAQQPRLPLVHSNLGLALQLVGRYEDALHAFEGALTIDPNDTAALYNRAATLHKMEREQECLETLERLLRTAPDFAPALRSRCSTLARLGRMGEARAALDDYLAACPDASDVDELRAMLR